MNAALALALALASSPSSSSSSRPLPPVLEGTDQIPAPAAVAAVPVDALVEVVLDASRPALMRARAARLLGGRGVGDHAVDDALRRARVGVNGPLAAQLTLALADRAVARGGQQALVEVGELAEAAVASADVDVVRAGVLLWWRVGGGAARARVAQLAATHPDERIRGACRGRLRRWPVAEGDDAGATVLDPAHGGPPPPR